MSDRIIRIVGAAALFLAGCQTAPEAEPGTKEAAVQAAWAETCASYYCEGYDGRITAINDGHIVVSINGNTRYLNYEVTGAPGSYVATVEPTPERGKTKP